MGGDGADAGHLVGGDGDAQPRAADEQAAVRLALGDELGALDGGVRVGGLVGRGVDADVGDGRDERALLEQGLERLLVRVAGVVAGNDDAEGLQVGGHGGWGCVSDGGRSRRKW